MNIQKSFTKLSVTAIVAVWGMFTFFMMCGDDNPTNPMSDAAFLTLKLCSLVSFLCIIKFCKFASKKGLL